MDGPLIEGVGISDRRVAIRPEGGIVFHHEDPGTEPFLQQRAGNIIVDSVDIKRKQIRCRRRFKTGFLAGTKADRWSEGEMAEDRGPNVLWRKFEDPETEAWMEHEGDGLAESGGDLIVAAVEVDGVVVVDAPGAAQ